MGYLFTDENALRVPGKTSLDELGFLGALAAQVPSGGKMVEIGAFYGRATRVMALANPSAQVVAVDTFQDVNWTRKYANFYRDIPVFGMAAFEKYTANLSNVRAILGDSPNTVTDWPQNIDLYFEDAVHGNPKLRANIDFWSARVKPGGIVCGHDYSHRFLDVKREVDRLALAWNAQVCIVGTLWALRKPGARRNTTIASDFMKEGGGQLIVANKKMGEMSRPPGMWTGAHLDPDRIESLRFVQSSKAVSGALQVRLGHPVFGETNWQDATCRVRFTPDQRLRPFTRVAFRYAPVKGKSPKPLSYRVSARQIGKNGTLYTGTSTWSENGAWAAVGPQKAAINAITLCFSAKPLSAQSKFKPRRLSRLRQAGRAIFETAFL